MRSFLASSGLTVGPLGVAVAAVALSTLTPVRADAHFILDKAADGGTIPGEPACFSEQDSLGIPEKSAPCGQDDTGSPVVATNIVSSFTPGPDGTTSITITTNEVVAHPGHYRIAIASDMNSLPADPAVDAGSSACGTAVVEMVPAGTIAADGVLADDVFDHTSPFSSPQSYTFKVPASVHCSPQCVLQVVEFMSDHGLNPQGGCFYHHCANISIGAAGQADAGNEARDAASGSSGTSSGATGSTSGAASGSGSGITGAGSSGTSGASGNASGATGSATGASAGSSGSGGSSGAGASGSSGTATSGTTGSGHSGSTSSPDASTGEPERSSSGGCAVGPSINRGVAPGLRFGVFALAALVLVRRRRIAR